MDFLPMTPSGGPAAFGLGVPGLGGLGAAATGQFRGAFGMPVPGLGQRPGVMHTYTRQPDDPTNQKVHTTLVVARKRSADPSNDVEEMCRGAYTFVQADPQGHALDNDVCRVKSVSALNYMLHKEPLKYKLDSAADLLNEWRPFGFQVLHSTENDDDPTISMRNFVPITFSVSEVSPRVPNIWLATGQRVMAFDSLWLLVRQQTQQRLSGTPLRYWRVEPYVTQSRQRPHRSLYSHVDPLDSTQSWVGACLLVGTVNDLHDEGQDPTAYADQAARAIFSTVPGSTYDYRRDLLDLPTINVLLNH